MLDLNKAQLEINEVCANIISKHNLRVVEASEDESPKAPALRLEWENNGVHYKAEFRSSELTAWQEQGIIKQETERRVKSITSNKQFPDQNPNDLGTQL